MNAIQPNDTDPQLARRPSPHRLWIASGILLAIFASWFTTHLPSPLGVWISSTFAAAAALWVLWESRRGGRLSLAYRLSKLPPDRRPQLAENWIWRRAWLRAPLFAGAVFVLAFSGIAGGVLALATTAIGAPSSRTVTITGTSSGRKTCRRFTVREVSLLMNRALCAPPEQLALARPGWTLTVSGVQSPFGINVAHYEVRPPQ